MSAGLLLTLAWRNLWRYPRRTIVILLAIIIGVWSMVAFGALTRGMIENQIERAIYNLLGHIRIHAPG